MNLFDAAILGVVQGATEYLPVSSSGHLVLVPWVFGFPKAPFVFDVLVQMGTLLGVVVYFWRDLLEVAREMARGLVAGRPLETPAARLGWYVGLATIPAALIGFFFKDQFERAFSSPQVALAFLLLTALLLVLGELLGRRWKTAPRSERELRLSDAALVGLAQALALFPGVSRSGSTIAAGMALGLGRAGAAKFSFLMSIPIMVGAGALAVGDLLLEPGALSEHGAAIAVGFVTSAVSGYACIHWFLGFLRRQSLMWFALYCALLGGGGLVWSFLWGAPSVALG